METTVIKIHHSVNTCAYLPGKFCRFVFTKNFGTEFFCDFFKEKLRDNSDGWLARCKSCIEFDDESMSLAT